MSKFIWVHIPTSGNTVYVDHRGNDETGDGSAQNPYQTILKATTVCEARTNIVIGDGEWSFSRYAGKPMNFYGNANTSFQTITSTPLNYNAYPDDVFYYINNITLNVAKQKGTICFNNCYINYILYDNGNAPCILAKNCFFHLENQQLPGQGALRGHLFVNCIFYWIRSDAASSFPPVFINCIFLNMYFLGNVKIFKFCNFTRMQIPKASQVTLIQGCINNASTGQTQVDYFNNYVQDMPLACDFTAKPGSANIGAGINGSTIGFNQGYPARATNDSNDIFAAANGATLRNVAWNATLNGYSLVHKDKFCAGYTVNTITLAADAEATDDYYNGLFIGITAGDGAGEIHRIVDYDGATRVATIDTSWQSAISTSSIYSISGTIDSATKDFGRVIKVKRNWAFLANMQSWTDPNVSSYGMWKEFLTSPLQNNGEWMMRPCSNFRYEYSIDNIEWHSSTELLAGTDTDNRTYNAAYGNASESYVAANAKTTLLRYVRYHIEIGFNIGEDAQ